MWEALSTQASLIRMCACVCVCMCVCVGGGEVSRHELTKLRGCLKKQLVGASLGWSLLEQQEKGTDHKGLCCVYTTNGEI